MATRSRRAERPRVTARRPATVDSSGREVDDAEIRTASRRSDRRGETPVDRARLDGCRRRHVRRHLDHPRAAAAARAHRRGAQALRALVRAIRDAAAARLHPPGTDADGQRDRAAAGAPHERDEHRRPARARRADRARAAPGRRPCRDARAHARRVASSWSAPPTRSTPRCSPTPALADDDMAELVRILARFRKDAGDFTDPRPIPDPL